MNKTLQAVSGTLTPNEESDALSVSSKYQVNDDLLVLDTMRLLKNGGTGMLSRANMFRLRLKRNRKEITADEYKQVEERLKFLRTLKKLRLFGRFLRAVKTNSLAEALDKLIALIRAAYRKENTRAPQQSPAAQMQAGVAFIKALLAPVTATALAAHMKRAANGPAAQQAAAFLNGLAGALAEDDEQEAGTGLQTGGQSAGKTARFDATFTGTESITMLQNVVEQLTKAELEIFKIARVLDASMSKGKEDEEDTPQHADDRRIRRMETVSEITRATPTALAAPNALLAYRMATKQVQVRQNMKLADKKQLFYVLVDSSASMASQIGANAQGMMMRGNIASALALSVVKKAYEEGSMVFFRFFAGAPDLLHQGKTRADLLDVSRKIGLGDYNGGGTCIKSALNRAFEDIQQARDSISKAEVLLITDACDSIDEQATALAKKGTKLHVLAIEASGGGRDTLKKVADKFYDVNGNNVLDFDKIAKSAVGNP